MPTDSIKAYDYGKLVSNGITLRMVPNISAMMRRLDGSVPAAMFFYQKDAATGKETCVGNSTPIDSWCQFSATNINRGNTIFKCILARTISGSLYKLYDVSDFCISMFKGMDMPENEDLFKRVFGHPMPHGK